MGKNHKSRFWEVDFLRGLALIMMVLYHLIYNFHYFAQYNIKVYSGFWLYFARTTATIFIFLVGVSLTLSFSKAHCKIKNNKELFLIFLKRGLKVFSWGLIITIITWFFLREGFIIFGILHFIGISIILAYLFLKLHFLNLLIGIIFIFIGQYLKGFSFSFYWLIWLGFKPDNFYTVDYFPLFPWFGVVLIGVFFGNLAYSNYSRKFQLPDFSDFSLIRLLCFFGRHSLFIYLIHQPLIILLLYFIGITNISL